MHKIIQLEDFVRRSGEPTVQVVGRSENGHWYTERSHEKHASEAFDYIQSVSPREGRTVILVNALGTFEYYDANRNGDGFTENTYRVGQKALCGHPGCNPPGLDGWINPDEVVTKHYQSFMSGGVFKNHVNTDIRKSLGRVERAFWNSYMHRIELLVEITNRLDADLVQRINAGEFPAVSMGCRVRWDVCAICGHRAPTRKQYCEHALRMREIDPVTGMLNCVLNPSPVFFDISFVFRPADRTGFMIQKVAEPYALYSSAYLGEKVASYEEKVALVRKLSDIRKEIVGDVAASRTMPELSLVRQYRQAMGSKQQAPLPQETIEQLAQHPISDVVSSLASKNAALSTSDFARLFLHKTAGVTPSHALLDRITAVQPYALEVLASYPGLIDKLSEYLDVERGETVKLSGFGDWAGQRWDTSGEGPSHMGGGYLRSAQEPPRTDTFTMSDPNSGSLYTTTRGAAMRANHQDMKSLIGTTAGLSALYGVGLYGLGRKFNVPGGMLSRALPAVALGAATAPHLLNAYRPYRNPQYLTDQGMNVSGGTEFRKVGFSMPALLDKLGADVASRLHSVNPGSNLQQELENKITTSAPWSKLATFLRDGASYTEKVSRLFKNSAVTSVNAYEPDALSLEAFGNVFGNLITD